LGIKPAIIWAAVSVLTVLWWALVPRIFEINTPPALAVAGYLYLPFTGYSFLLFLAADVFGFVLRRFKGIKFGSKYELLAVFAVASALVCYGYFESKNIRTIELDIPTDKLPAGADSIRIVQISDLHMGKTFDVDILNRAMEIAESAKPDLIALTGDIVDMDMRRDEYFVKILGSVSAPLGKFAVTGNHEHYSGLDQASDFMERAGYTVLHSEWRDLGPIVVAGVDDPGRDIVSRQNEGLALLSSLPDGPRGKFILFLKHQPHVHEDTTGLFDLHLSGHTHGGQLWPLGYLVCYLHGVEQGLSVYGDSFLFVSNGTGYWGPPVRVGAPPQVIVINVVRRPI
jgi:predicted MPP superfamily phosphohydrolase